MRSRRSGRHAVPLGLFRSAQRRAELAKANVPVTILVQRSKESGDLLGRRMRQPQQRRRVAELGEGDEAVGVSEGPSLKEGRDALHVADQGGSQGRETGGAFESVGCQRRGRSIGHGEGDHRAGESSFLSSV